MAHKYTTFMPSFVVANQTLSEVPELEHAFPIISQTFTSKNCGQKVVQKVPGIKNI